MIDLHLHLDGSLDERDFLYLLNKEGLEIPSSFPKCINVPKGCTSLEEYLTRFDLSCSLMQTRENLRYVTRSLVNRLYQLGYIYAEIRFASLLHTKGGLSQVEVINAVLEGLKEGLIGKSGINCNLIVCLMKNASMEENKKTIEAVLEINSPKIVAIDLAGPEAYRPTSDFKDLFKMAKDHDLNITIHAGEACGNESILEAVEVGAKRIGHGVHLSFDKNTIKIMKEKKIAFEFCPTSNLQTTSLPNYESVPLLSFKKKGIKVSINSDNMTVSHTNVIEEFKHLKNVFNLSEEDIKYYIENAIDMAFINKEEKERLYGILPYKYKTFFEKLT